MSHNKMPKDTVEELVKNTMYAMDVEWNMSLQDDSITYYKSYQLYAKIREALTTAYRKGVEALRASIEKEKWTTSDGDKVFSYDDVQEHTERLLKQVSL